MFMNSYDKIKKMENILREVYNYIREKNIKQFPELYWVAIKQLIPRLNLFTKAYIFIQFMAMYFCDQGKFCSITKHFTRGGKGSSLQKEGKQTLLCDTFHWSFRFDKKRLAFTIYNVSVAAQRGKCLKSSLPILKTFLCLF